MTIFEILKFNRELLERLRNIGVADKYGISERKVYSLLRHFRNDCNPGAV